MSRPSSRARILIIGAGLGGLVAALALIDRGFDVELYEQAPELGEVGAGLTLSTGAQQVLRALGLMDRIAPFACPAARFPFLHYKTARLLIGELDRGDGKPDDGIALVDRQIHRADLHHVLASAFLERAPGRLHVNHRLVGIEENQQGVRAVFADGSIAYGDGLVAADGVRSSARGLLWGADAPRFTGQVAYRFLVDRTTAAPFMKLGRGAVFIGPQRTFNRYTLRAGDVVNCVGIAVSDTWVDDGWAVSAGRKSVLNEFSDWHPDVTGLVGRSQNLIRWGIFDRAPLSRWRQGRATLLGDAAHAMLPFLGMGAAMAIEDAFILARIMDADNDIEVGFDRYEANRRPRTELLHAKSLHQGKLVQAQEPDDYDGRAAPANDPAIKDYNPVLAAI